ncbi:MAG: hypothetical protein HYY93_13505, partial [Planctomycetes bacterium]|nr:hypothetical protein [Planctomycetota bacterium]
VRAEEVRLAFLLRATGDSVCLGRTPCLGEFKSEASPPRVSFEASVLRIGALQAALPQFGRRLNHAVAPSGFVIAAPAASQRLWVIHSP